MWGEVCEEREETVPKAGRHPSVPPPPRPLTLLVTSTGASRIRAVWVLGLTLERPGSFLHVLSEAKPAACKKRECGRADTAML